MREGPGNAGSGYRWERKWSGRFSYAVHEPRHGACLLIVAAELLRVESGGKQRFDVVGGLRLREPGEDMTQARRCSSQKVSRSVSAEPVAITGSSFEPRCTLAQFRGLRKDGVHGPVTIVRPEVLPGVVSLRIRRRKIDGNEGCRRIRR